MRTIHAWKRDKSLDAHAGKITGWYIAVCGPVAAVHDSMPNFKKKPTCKRCLKAIR